MKKNLRIAVIGSSFSGSLFTRQLERYLKNPEVIVFEKNTHSSAFPHWTQPEKGAAILINPNGMSTIKHYDNALYRQLRKITTPRVSIKIDSININHENLCEIKDIIDNGLADDYGATVRWDSANNLLRSLLDESRIVYGMQLASYKYNPTTHKISLSFHENSTYPDEDFGEFDLLVAADGRYSTVRNTEGPFNLKDSDTTTYYNISNFRLLVPNTSVPIVEDLKLIYNIPDKTEYPHYQDLPPFNSLCRVGLSHCQANEKNPAGSTYLFGNFALGNNTEISPVMKNSDFLKALFMPAGGSSNLTKQGKWLMSVLENEYAKIHWSRFQSTPIKFTPTARANTEALPILYLGDAAHAFPPSLGQGATTAIEDAYYSSEIFIDSIIEHQYFVNTSSYPFIITLLEKINAQRKSRIEMIKNASISAGNHLISENMYEELQHEAELWAKSSQWRNIIRSIWKGYPRPKDESFWQ